MEPSVNLHLAPGTCLFSVGFHSLTWLKKKLKIKEFCCVLFCLLEKCVIGLSNGYYCTAFFSRLTPLKGFKQLIFGDYKRESSIITVKFQTHRDIGGVLFCSPSVIFLTSRVSW